jgi:predicted transcriptional regulator
MQYKLKTELITNYIKENNLTKAAFCKLCSVSLGSLNKLLSNNPNTRLLTILKVLRTADIRGNDFFVKSEE